MAAAINTNAVKLAQQAFEIGNALYQAETLALDLPTPDITARNTFISPNLENGTVTITMVLPITVSLDADGGMSFDAVDYLPNVA